MPPGMSTLDWAGFITPLLVYFIFLIIYYIWEGKRERRLRQEYEGEHVE